MKAKSLIALFVVVSILLVYSMICYNLLNTRIQVDTRYIIDNYLQTNYPEIKTYEYVKAVSTKKDTFQVLIKADKDYYTFHFSNINQAYQLLSVDEGTPNYII